jgi:CubicO group peptidase (beta-lactamase class C family)
MTPSSKMRISLVFASFLFLTVFLLVGVSDTPGVSAQSGELQLQEERGMDQELAGLLDQIPSLLRRARVPGLSLAVIRGGEIQWSGGFGIRDSEAGDSVDASTLFEAASLSKALCAYAALRMLDRGALELDRPLVDYLDTAGLRAFIGDEFQDSRIESITARMVLTHSSGLPNWRRNEPLRILDDPGRNFSYSGEGFVFLQTVLEEICQCTYADLMDREVLGPLEMRNSDFRWVADFENRIASRHDDRGQVVDRAWPVRVHAAGTLLTTAEDYGRFLIAVMAGTGLEPESQKEMTGVQFRFPGRDGSTISWGLGVGVDGPPDPVAVWHHGDNRTAMAFVLGLPETGDGVVYFANGENGLGFLEEIVGGALGTTDPVQSFRHWTNYPRIR